MNLRDLKLRARALFAPRRVERELDDELAFHIDRETEKLVAEGMPAAEARARALARFGPVPLAADECRDARGTAFVDDTVRDILYALRTFRRAPLVAFTIVSTVALGLGLVAVAFTMLNALLFRVDAVPDVHEMFAVERPRTADGERQRFTRAQFDALRRETNVFTDAYAELSDVDSRVDGRLMFGTFVTGNFFQVLGVNAAMGRALTPADDEPFAGQPVMVLSHRGWDRLFARDPAILGRRLLVNGRHVRDRRRDARGISRTDRRTRRLLGAALDARSRSPDPSGPRSDCRPRHHRTPEAGPVAADGTGGTRRLGCRPVERQSDRARRVEHHARPEARYRPAASRSGGRGRAPVLCVRPHPADWLCQRRQPAPRQGAWRDSVRLASGCRLAPPAAASSASC